MPARSGAARGVGTELGVAIPARLFHRFRLSPRIRVCLALGFLLLGWAVLYATGQRTKHGTTLGLAYSFDMLLPLVQLDKKHDDVDLDPWPQRYFYLHKIVGVILTSFIVAGISGLDQINLAA